MSGGHFSYKEHAILEIAREIDSLVSENEYSETTLVLFRESAAVLYRAFDMVHRIDMLVCADDSEKTFNEKFPKLETETCDHLS